MPLIQITNTYQGDVLDIVRQCTPEGFQIRTLESNTEQALLSCIADADYILASGRVKISRAVLEQAPRLKMIQRTGVGLDSLDLDAMRDLGIPLYVNQGVNSQSVAEHTILLMLACLRRLTLLDRNLKQGVWKSKEQAITTRELCGKTVGLIGLGSIGSRVAAILRAFQVKTLYHTTSRKSPELEHELGIEYASLEQLYAQADIVSLHCPSTPETRGMIHADALRLMKDGVVIVNTARGGLIDEAALLRAIQSGKVAFAGLDVHAEEPCPPHDPIIASDRVIATPHVGGVTYDAFSAMMTAAMRNIALFEQGDLAAIADKRKL